MMMTMKKTQVLLFVSNPRSLSRCILSHHLYSIKGKRVVHTMRTSLSFSVIAGPQKRSLYSVVNIPVPVFFGDFIWPDCVRPLFSAISWGE